MLKFHHLEVLIAIVEAGGIRPAARALHVSQAAITKTLKSLEEAAGIPLLLRQSRGMELTEAGKNLLVRAKAIARQMNLAEEELQLAQGYAGGSVRVALTPFVALTSLGEAYDWFRQRFPSVKIQFAEGLLHRVVPRLRDGTLDFAVVAAAQNLAEDSNLTSVRLGSVKQHVVLRKNHPLSRAPTAKALANEEWILTHPMSRADGSRIAAMFLGAGVAPPERVLVCDAMAALSLQRTTNAVGIMPEPILKHPWAQGIVQAPDTELRPPDCEVLLLHRSDVPLTPAAHFLAHCLQSLTASQCEDLGAPATQRR